MKSTVSLLLLAVFSLVNGRAQEIGRFETLDKNGDGKLSREEFPMPRLFDRFDRNGDGFVTLDEVRLRRGGSEPSGDENTVKSDIAYGELAAQTLDLYLPKDAEKAPVMVYVHGGGWSKGDKKAVGLKPSFFQEQGWVFSSINYRLLPEGRHPENVNDVAAAIAWIHDHICAEGGDPDRIFVMGHSAGAHLAALVATDHRPLERSGKSLAILKGVIALDTNAYDLPTLSADSSGGFYSPVFGTDFATLKDASPLHHLAPGKDIPPFLICYSRGTGARPQAIRPVAAEAFREALSQAGVPAEVVDASDRNHGEINQWFGKADDEKVTGKAKAFLGNLVNPKSPE